MPSARRSIALVMSLAVLLCIPASAAEPAWSQESHADEPNLPAVIDETGHPVVNRNHLVKLQAEVPHPDRSKPRMLQAGVADWSLADLGIEYNAAAVKSQRKVTITRIRLGTWASRAALRAGDVILDVSIKNNAYLIKIDRNGTVYLAHLSKAEGTRLSGKVDKPALTGNTIVPAVATAAVSKHPNSFTAVTYNVKLYTEVNLALCVPQPTDGWGRGQWDLLASERSGKLGGAWDTWLDGLRAQLNRDWPRFVSGFGFSDMHVVMINGQVAETTLQHRVPHSEFTQQVASYLQMVQAPYPAGSEMHDLHLEIKIGRTQINPP